MASNIVAISKKRRLNRSHQRLLLDEAGLAVVGLPVGINQFNDRLVIA
jgi:hypothetical protein